jgi:hypothetical protein
VKGVEIVKRLRRSIKNQAHTRPHVRLDGPCRMVWRAQTAHQHADPEPQRENGPQTTFPD